MVSIEQSFREVLSEDVVLFTEDCSPYYVGPAVSKTLWGEAGDDSLIEEVTGIVSMISSLKLRLSYIMPLESAPCGSTIKCNVSKFSHGYKVKLIGDDAVKSRKATPVAPAT